MESVAGQQQHHQLASCALGFPFTLGLIGTPGSSTAQMISYHSFSSERPDAQCTVQRELSDPAAVCSSGTVVHSLVGNHSMRATQFVRMPPPVVELMYTVERATVPPVTTLTLDASRTPLSTPDGLTNRRRLLFLLGSSRPTGAHYVVTTTTSAAGDGSTQQFTTNSTLLWLSLTSEGRHNLTVFTVDTVGVEDPSPLTLRWLADFTAPSTTIVSGPVQPVTAATSARFKFGCSDNSRAASSPSALCSYRLNLDEAPATTTTGGSSSTAAPSSAETLLLSPTTLLRGGGTLSPSPILAFTIVQGNQVKASSEYRLLRLDSPSSTDFAVAATSSRDAQPWLTLASVTVLSVGPLRDGGYVLQLRKSSGASGSVVAVAFSVDTTAPRTHVHNVTRQIISGSTSARWQIAASGGVGEGSATPVLWWSAGAKWRRTTLLSAGTLVTTLPLSATVLRLKAEDAAGNVDPFPRTISWGTALSLLTAPPAATFDSSAVFSLSTASAAADPSASPTHPSPLVLQWRVDGADWQPSSASTRSLPVTIRLVALAPGPHVFEARPLADDGSPDAVQRTPVYHTWEVLASTFLDGSAMAFHDLPDGPHQLEARAVDAAGNMDGGSAFHSWRIDSAPPMCSAALQRDASQLSVNSSEPLASVQLRMGGAQLWTTVPISPALPRVTVAAPAPTSDGHYTLSVKATDAVGNSAPDACAVLHWTHDTTAPALSLRSAPSSIPSVTNQRVWNATAVARDVLSPVRALFYAVQRLEHGVTHAAVPRMTWVVAATAADTTAAHNKTLNVAVAVAVTGDDGQYSLWLKAVDGVGNVALLPSAFNWTLDTTPPVVRLQSPPAPVLASFEAPFTVTALDAAAGLLFATRKLLSAGQQQSPPPPLAWARVPLLPRPAGGPQPPSSGETEQAVVVLRVTVPPSDGWYALALKVVDAAGNTMLDVAAHTWGVDTTAPTAAIVAAPSNFTLGSLIPATFVLRCVSVAPCPPSAPTSRCAQLSDCSSYRYRVVATATVGASTASGDSGGSCARQQIVVLPWQSTTSRHISLRSHMLSAGNLRLEVKAVDAMGWVQSPPAVHAWLVTRSQPVVVMVTSQPPPVTAWRTASFTFVTTMRGLPYAAAGGQLLQLRVDTAVGPWQPLPHCALHHPRCNHTLRGMSRGPHVLQVRAVDAVGGGGGGGASAAARVQWSVGACDDAFTYALVNASDGGALRCPPCPVGGDCAPLHTTPASMGAARGFWSAPGADGRAAGERHRPPFAFFRCPLPGSCEGGGNATTPSLCAPAFRIGSVLCGTCVHGHVRSQARCVPCAHADVELALALVSVLLFTLAIIAMNHKRHNQASAAAAAAAAAAPATTATALAEVAAAVPSPVPSIAVASDSTVTAAAASAVPPADAAVTSAAVTSTAAVTPAAAGVATGASTSNTSAAVAVAPSAATPTSAGATAAAPIVVESDTAVAHTRRMVVMRILLAFLSIQSTIGDFHARAPRALRDFFQFTTHIAAGVSLRFAPVRCVLGLPFLTEAFLTMVAQLPLLLLCALFAAVRYRSLSAIMSFTEGCAVYLLFISYPSITRALLQVFRCTSVTVRDATYLLEDLSVACHRGVHAALLPLAALCLPLFALGVPAAIVLTSRTARRRPGPRAQAQLMRLAFLFDGYHTEHGHWWAAVVLFRRFTLQCVVTFVASPSLQASLASVTLVLGLAMHLWWRPYAHPFLNNLDTVALSVSYLTQATSSMSPSLGGNATTESAITVLLIALNLSALLLLLAVYVGALRVSASHALSHALRAAEAQQQLHQLQQAQGRRLSHRRRQWPHLHPRSVPSPQPPRPQQPQQPQPPLHAQQVVVLRRAEGLVTTAASSAIMPSPTRTQGIATASNADGSGSHVGRTAATVDVFPGNSSRMESGPAAGRTIRTGAPGEKRVAARRSSRRRKSPHHSTSSRRRDGVGISSAHRDGSTQPSQPRHSHRTRHPSQLSSQPLHARSGHHRHRRHHHPHPHPGGAPPLHSPPQLL